MDVKTRITIEGYIVKFLFSVYQATIKTTNQLLNHWLNSTLQIQNEK